MRLHQLVARRKAKVLRWGDGCYSAHNKAAPQKASSNKRNLTVLCTCEGVDCGNIALLPSSSCCHRDGVLGTGVELCQGDGGNIFGHCQLKQKVNVVRF